MNHFYENINGFMKDGNKKMFDHAISLMPQNCKWVELGAWTGKSAAYCAVELMQQEKFGKFTTLDSWHGGIELKDHNLVIEKQLKDVFLDNVAPIKDRIEIIQGISWENADKFKDNSLDFCYVDAGHTYEDVTKDLNAWYPKIKSGMYFGGDDYTKGHPGVLKAVQEFFNEKKIKVKKIGRCWFIKKP